MYRIGVNLGENTIHIGLVDAGYQLITQMKKEIDNKDYKEVVSQCVDLLQQMMLQFQVKPDELQGIGIGCPGAVDSKRGVVLFSKRLEWKQVPLLQEFHKYMNFPMALANNANCLALGEAKNGAGKNYDSEVLLFIGEGVGGGVIINGKILKGCNAGAMELGHILIRKEGALCECGRRGCLEAYTSSNAVEKQIQEAVKNNPDSKLVAYAKEGKGHRLEALFQAAKEKDEAALSIVHQYISYLGEGIVDFINIFRPDCFLLSGAVCQWKEEILPLLNQYVKKNCYAGDGGFVPEISCALLGEKAGILGAAALTE